jgi:ParB/RepB/Spo0J family partition protein
VKEFNSATGAAIDETDPVVDPALERGDFQADCDAHADATNPFTSPQFGDVPLDVIVTSRTNPRQTFDPVKLQELADSIRSTGVMQPIVLRPMPAERLADTTRATDASQKLLDAWPHKQKRMPRPFYEIVSGERRYRASVIAEQRTVPAIVRNMTDQEVLEAQLVENLQRDDLHPLEEAEGYRRLCETTGITKKAIGAKIGKSRTYVYQRLSMIELGQEARDAYRAGKLDFSKALLLAGVADPKVQLKALKEVTTEQYGGRTMTVREFAVWLEKNVMLKLEHAPFDITDATLNGGAGTCAECPKRTGVNRDIFEAFDSPDMCTDAKCYGMKASISLQRIKDAAAEKGMKVIAGVEAKKLKPHSYGDTIKGYTRLDEKMEGGSVSKLLGKDAPTAIVFVDPHTHKQIKVLPTEVVGELLKDKGIKVAKAGQVDFERTRKQDEAKRQAKAAYETAWRTQAANAIDGAVRGGAIVSFSAEVLRLLCALLFAGLAGDEALPLLALWGLPAAASADEYEARRANYDALERHIPAAPDLELGRMVLTLLMAREIEWSPYDHEKEAPAIARLATETGIDVTAIQREVKAAQKAAAKEAAQPPGAKVQAAQADTVAPDGGKAAAKKPAGRGRKALSEEEAKSGIADAMQGVDPTSGRFEVGARVRFKQDLKGHSGKLRKVSGREGTVKSVIGDRAYGVSYGDKAHEVATADYTELEAIDTLVQAWPFPIKGSQA